LVINQEKRPFFKSVEDHKRSAFVYGPPRIEKKKKKEKTKRKKETLGATGRALYTNPVDRLSEISGLVNRYP
jgi:hypothetical protein